MAYLNLDRLPDVRFQKALPLNEGLGSKKIYSVFLSYRRVDKQYVAKVVQFLNALDASIYIDFLDDELNNTPNDQTAPTLRKRIQQSKKMIQLITPNSSDSKWMPWELGLGDGVLGYPNAVILPTVTTHFRNFDQEYIKMYGRIETSDSRDGTRNDWAVLYPNGDGVWFRQWLIS
ncbi:TIR domain-containing protein [Rudanella paleaurantiibacter]|uniref:TIR domain-containing protein n=1 Tax=Rudanella paleaurantiibacter TaxID=2614655 RepID=A0A7J5TS65_9BACT|nr:toll/interleukin-1 receptor domain-containing protein [Rudanella paleaurantiibacter]KAB7725849.1 TIR domain-containing protein [Rudanella paleaurantiibacter]